MLAIFNSLNAPNFPIFQPILMILVSNVMVHRVLFDKVYLTIGLLLSLNVFFWPNLRPRFCFCLKRKTGLTHMEPSNTALNNRHVYTCMVNKGKKHF